MKAFGHLLWDILGSWFLASCAISVWLLLFVALPTLHTALFSVVPADGPVTATERIQLDQSFSFYLIYGDRNQLRALTQTEQDHMVEVRSVLTGVVIKLILSCLYLLFAYKHVDSHSTRGALAIVGLLGLLSAMAFEQLFVGMHELFFVHSQWVLPSDTFVLTQIYPENFFAYTWGGIVGLSLLTIGILHFWLRSRIIPSNAPGSLMSIRSDIGSARG